MGIFLPVNYKLDNSTPYLAKKELFKLYPGTTFFSKKTLQGIDKADNQLELDLAEAYEDNLIKISDSYL